MHIMLTVTQDHITRGMRKTRNFCPVALALHEAGFPEVVVFARNYRLSTEHHHRLNGPEIFEFISRFDMGKPVDPMSFPIQI